MTSASLTWEVTRRESETVVSMRGVINETVDFNPLRELFGPIVFDLAAVRRINSEGTRRWMELLRAIREHDEVFLESCSVAVVTQLNMLPELQRVASVRSFFVPLVCEACNAEDYELVEVTDVLRNARSFSTSKRCKQDESQLVLDDQPDRYFAFLWESEVGGRAGRLPGHGVAPARGDADPGGARVRPAPRLAPLSRRARGDEPHRRPSARRRCLV